MHNLTKSSLPFRQIEGKLQHQQYYKIPTGTDSLAYFGFHVLLHHSIENDDHPYFPFLKARNRKVRGHVEQMSRSQSGSAGSWASPFNPVAEASLNTPLPGHRPQGAA